MRIGFASLLAAILTAGLYGIVSAYEKAHRKTDYVVLYLQWFDQAQFAGFYVAQIKGFYANLGMNVEIMAKPATNEPWDVPVKVFENEEESRGLVGSSETNRVAFGIWTGDQVLKEATEKKLYIKAIGSVFDRSLACFMVRDQQLNGDKLIGWPKDFGERTVGVYAGYDTKNLLSWLKDTYKPDKEPNYVELTPGKDDPITLLATGLIDVLPCYVIDEPILAKLKDSSQKFRLMTPDQYQLKYYSDTIITSRSLLSSGRRADPDLAARFLAASEEGWRYALAHRDEATKIVISRDSPRLEVYPQNKLQSMMLGEISNYVNTNPQKSMFKMDPDTWSSMANILNLPPFKNENKDCDNICDFDVADSAYSLEHPLLK